MSRRGPATRIRVAGSSLALAAVLAGCAAPAGAPHAATGTRTAAATPPAAPTPGSASRGEPRQAPVPLVVATPPAPHRAAPAPVALSLPAAGIDAAVDAVGVDADGLMALPPDPDRGGWYRFGARPGGPRGQAVLAAHVDSLRYGVGQFARLASSEVGDPVVVRLAGGRTLRYRVSAVDKAPKQTVRLDALFDLGGPSRLALVTCGGTFDRDGGGYSDNVVVLAVPETASRGSR